MSTKRSGLKGLLAAMLVSSIPATLILPMMPSLGKAFSVDATQLGLLVGVYPLMSMLASPFWGRLSDRYGRKPILVTTLLGGAAAFLCFALSTSWLGLFAGRALQGLAGTPRGIGFAVASDRAGSGERTSGMGAVTSAMAIGFTVGPLMGGLLMGENPDSWLGELRHLLGLAPGGFSHVVPSLFGVLLNAGAAVIILFSFQETWKPGNAAKAIDESVVPTHSFAVAIVQRSVVIAILFFLLSGLVQGSLQFAFALWGNMDRGWLAQEIAWAGVIIGLGFALGSGGILRPMVHRIGQEKTVLTGSILDATGLMLFLYFQHAPVLAMTGLLISSLGNSLWATTMLGLLSRDIDAQDQGLALGVANGASLLGRVAGPALAGYLASTIDAGAPFVLILGCVVVTIMRGVALTRNAALAR